jgi:hypothetical protein
MRYYLFLLSLFVSIAASAKAPDVELCDTTRPAVPVPASINNFKPKKKIVIGKHFIQNGFEITLSDTSYKVKGFRVIYLGKHCDVYIKEVFGAAANTDNLPILKHLTAKDKIFIECITIAKNKKLFTTEGFLILVGL